MTGLSFVPRAFASAVLLPLVVFTPVGETRAAQEQMVRRPDIGVAFLPPVSFRAVKTTGKRYLAVNPTNARIIIRQVLRDDAASTLPPDAAVVTFPLLHGNTHAKTVVKALPDFSVGDAVTSVALLQFTRSGKSYEVCHILALKDGYLCQFELIAPASVFKGAFRAFSQTVRSVQWLTPPNPLSKTLPPTNAPATVPPTTGDPALPALPPPN